jgi:hypothetical protein
LASKLYSVQINTVQAHTVNLTICIVHPDITVIPTSKTFALQLLYDPILGSEIEKEVIRNSPLPQELNLDDILDQSWLIDNAGGFIRSVHLAPKLPISVTPKSEGLDLVPTSENEMGAYQCGEYEIVVSHPGWVQHLKPGLAWDTVSYDAGEAKEWKLPPRRPGDSDWVTADNQEDGFIQRSQSDLMGADILNETQLKSLVLPKYKTSDYYAEPELSGSSIAEKEMMNLLGQVVHIHSRTSDRLIGTLVRVDGEGILVYQEKSSSFSSLYFSYNDIEIIGMAVFRRRT